MGRTCCVVGCNSNYGSSSQPYVSTFKFPNETKEPERFAKWKNAISRENYNITANSVVCIKHFHPQFIIKFDEFKAKDGSMIQVAREIPKLTDDAYPSIFENLPSYKSSVPAKRRKDPSEREQEMARAQIKRNFKLQEERDMIKDFENLKGGLERRKVEPFFLKCYENYIMLVKVEDDDFLSTPHLVTVKIATDLKVKVFNNFEELSCDRFKPCLGFDLKCDRWSKFEALLQALPNRDDRTLKEKISCFAERMVDIVVWCELSEGVEEEKAAKIKFLSEQLKLAVATSIRYSSEMLIWAASIYYTYPGAYKSMRETQHLTLPHPKYLQKLLCKIGNDGSGIGPTQAAFLKEKFKLLGEEDKTVSVMLDEIYVNSKLVYKSGKVFGIAEHGNTDSTDLTAGTIQAFMSQSFQSKNKDVVALFPVRNLDGEMLQQLTLEVLKLMCEVGFFVLCLASDNNQVNKRMFQLLCGGELKTQIPNPYDQSRPLFLLFDQVHLFKNLRNNWLNAPNQTLSIPDSTELPLFEQPLHTSNPLQASVSASKDNDSVLYEVTFTEAKFFDVKALFHAEASSVLKLGPKLSRKAVYPSSVERQNVSLVDAVFQDSTRVALQTLKNDNGAEISDGTILFLQIVGRWWKITNVKHPFKGRRLSDMWCEPVMSCDDMKIKFLKDLITYMELWDLADGPGKLSPQTYTAFHHTLKATVELCDYVFKNLSWKYVLLGKLQTDNLEGRFGCYRRISGCSYFVTVEQVLEADRKLKLLSILKLKSAQSGAFSLTTFAEDCNKTAAELGEQDENLEVFEGIFSETEYVTITLTDQRVLLCLASYAATKTLQQFSREKKEICTECKANLITNEPLEIERAKEMYDYLSGLDRGGLNKPADFPFHLCMDAFKLFQTLISPKYEEHFLKLHYQQRAFVTLGLKRRDQTLDDMIFSCDSCKCNVSMEKVLKKCLRILANTFMNNYTKTLNEKNTARKIAIKLSKQEEKKKAEEMKKNAEAEKFSKAKDVAARKIAKLSSQGSS